MPLNELVKANWPVLDLDAFDIRTYGAVADDATVDNKGAIQAAVDAANAKYTATGAMQSVFIPPGVFWVGARAITNTGESTQNGIISVQLRSGVRLYGTGTIKAMPSLYGAGAYFRIIGSDRGARISNVILEGFGVDGNRSNQVASTQCSNIVLEVSNNIRVEGVRSVEANGNGMMVRGRYPDTATNIRISNCYVYGCNSIGIQSSQFNGLVIADNTVDTTANNCIDVYGDTGVSGSVSNGVNFSITGNTVRNSDICGIFPETVANGVVSGNSIYNCREGIHINRIYSVPKNIVVSSNSIYGSSDAGIWISGDMQGINIFGNTISDWLVGTAAIKLGTSVGNVSNVYIHGNVFNPTVANSYVLQIQAVLASRIECRNNMVRNNIGLAMGFVYNNTASTSTGVYVDSWAFTAGSVESTGLQMYRSGTFTPTVAGSTTAGTATYSTQSGQYTRIGDLVHFSLSLEYNSATGTGPLLIKGLPFTPSNLKLQPEVVAHSSMGTTSAAETLWAAATVDGLSPRIRTVGAAGVTRYLVMDGSNFVAGTLRVSGFYYV